MIMLFIFCPFFLFLVFHLHLFASDTSHKWVGGSRRRDVVFMLKKSSLDRTNTKTEKKRKVEKRLRVENYKKDR